MIYADFTSISVPKDNGEENLNVSYTNKRRKIMFLLVMVTN